jgi:hypothetical protein
LRRARERAGWLRALAMRRALEADPVLGPVTPRRSPLADAVEALGWRWRRSFAGWGAGGLAWP